MRKKRNIVVLISGIILVLVMLAGCSSQNASTGSSANTGANATQAVQATPEVTPSSAVEVASSEADQPASPESSAVEETVSSAETVTDNPNIIDGIDFTSYNNSEVPMHVLIKRQNVKFDKLTAIVTIHRDENNEPMSKAVQISNDGDSYVGKLDSKIYIYYFGDKKIEKIEDDSKQYSVGTPDGETRGMFSTSYNGGENEKITCTVTYEDGTQESITMYFTLD